MIDRDEERALAEHPVNRMLNRDLIACFERNRRVHGPNGLNARYARAKAEHEQARRSPRDAGSAVQEGGDAEGAAAE